jgi:tetratricopeptide (TPR) repeat protein
MKISLPGITPKTIISCAAASFLICFGICAFYLYVKSNPEKLFSENYTHYTPHILREATGPSHLRAAYTGGKMDSVIWDFKNTNAPIPEEYLLAGIAYLEKNEPGKAIETFKTLIRTNENSKTDYFEDDAEYYLAMSYLDDNQTGKALPLFEKIQSEPENRHYEDVSELFLLKLKISIAKK